MTLYVYHVIQHARLARLVQFSSIVATCAWCSTICWDCVLDIMRYSRFNVYPNVYFDIGEPWGSVPVNSDADAVA